MSTEMIFSFIALAFSLLVLLLGITRSVIEVHPPREWIWKVGLVMAILSSCGVIYFFVKGILEL